MDAKEDSDLAVVVPLPRQQRRAHERQAEKLAELTEKAAREGERELAAADKRMAALMKARALLFAMARENGRIRVSRAHLDALTDRDQLAAKVQENGDIVLTFVTGGGG